MAESVVVGAFAFGVPASIPPNEAIGNIASHTALVYDAPIVTQQDVPIEKVGLRVYYLPGEEAGNPPPTLRVAKAVVALAIDVRASKISTVAAPPQMRRVLRDMRRIAWEMNCRAEIHPVQRIYDEYPLDFWFSEMSTQSRTRSRFRWLLREIPLRLMPFWLYKLVAS